MATAGRKRHALALSVWMLLAAVFGFSALVLLGDESVGYALGLTTVVTMIASVFLMIRLRRTGHL